MRCSILLSTFVVLTVATGACWGSWQISSATEAAARELVEIMLRDGGREAATELAEMGGEAAVRQLLEKAVNEGGRELVERITAYGTRYGPAALKAVEPSPSQMIRALDHLAPDMVGPAIRAAAREPQVTTRLVAAYGKDGLELAARHPGVGASLAEKLGADGIVVGQRLTTDQAVMFARYADDIAALPTGERNQLLNAMMKAPAQVLDYLERHPKVLLTAGGVAAIIAVKDNVLGGAASPSSHEDASGGLVERVIFGLGDRFAVPIVFILAIIGGGVFCYVTIQLHSLWKLKAFRLEREKARRSLADRSPRRRNVRRSD